MEKLNLGYGFDKLDGYTNLDKKDLNLNIMPYPFMDNKFDEIILYHVLEHLKNPYDVVIELHRIIKTGGILKIVLPQFACVLPHYRFFHSRHYFNCITKDFKSNCRQHNKLFDEIIFKYNFVGIKRDFPFIKFDLNWEFKKL